MNYAMFDNDSILLRGSKVYYYFLANRFHDEMTNKDITSKSMVNEWLNNNLKFFNDALIALKNMEKIEDANDSKMVLGIIDNIRNELLILLNQQLVRNVEKNLLINLNSETLSKILYKIYYCLIEVNQLMKKISFDIDYKINVKEINFLLQKAILITRDFQLHFNKESEKENYSKEFRVYREIDNFAENFITCDLIIKKDLNIFNKGICGVCYGGLELPIIIKSIDDRISDVSILKFNKNVTGYTKKQSLELRFFDIFKVGLNSGATYVRGQNKGSLDTSTVISKLDPGFTYPMKNSGTFTINGVSIYVDTTKDTIQDVIDKVNKSGAGVTMAYDTNTDKFSLTSNSNERIKVGGPNDTSSFLLSTGLVYHQQTEQTIGSEGTKAEFTLNGTKYTRDTNEVSDVVPGMTFNISSTGTTVFNVKTDTDKAVKAVAEFASKYNTLINALNPTEIAYNDDLRSNYSEPLTDDKKATMSEDEIKTYQENYEKIAYYDLISKSSEIRTLKTGIRANLSSTVNTDNSKYHTIFDVGFVIAGSDTRNTEVTKLGLLFDVSTDPAELETYIKESTDFVSTLSEDPDGVYNFFAASETVYEKDPDTGKETSKLVNIGWGKVYSDYLDTTVNSSSALYKKTSTNGTIESEISSLKEQIDAKTRRVEMYLERLYAQFAAMEERVGALQQSASYLTNLGSSGTSK